MIKENLVPGIRARKQTPIIGVMGATIPSEEYTAKMGIDVGYALRKYIQNRTGTIFTGGVDGTGVDTYIGVMKFCRDQAIAEGKIQDDRFFVLIPKFEGDYSIQKMPAMIYRYNPPSAYSALGKLSLEGKLRSELAGEDMSDRRQYVGQVADVLVVLNGAYGTLDEISKALYYNKPIITLTSTGGAAGIVSALKNGKLDSGDIDDLKRRRIKFDPKQLDLVFPSNDVNELMSNLDNILKL